MITVLQWEARELLMSQLCIQSKYLDQTFFNPFPLFFLFKVALCGPVKYIKLVKIR